MRFRPDPRKAKLEALGSPSGERNKLIAMGVLLVLVLAAFFAVRLQEQAYRQREASTLPTVEDAAPLPIATPTIDAEALRALVADTTTAERVALDRDALALALEQTSTLLDSHFEPMHGRELDALGWREVTSDPDGWRAALYRVRGRVDELEEEQGASGPLWRGRLAIEGELPVFFAVRRVPSGLELGDWVRIDAIFVELFRDEVGGAWIEGPFFAGPRAIRSYAPLGADATALHPYAFLEVTDAGPDSGGSLADYRQELFELLAYAAAIGPDAVDWAAAPELDSPMLEQVFTNGAPWRGKPFRIPLGKLMAITNRAAGENPARMERVMEGWIGSQIWRTSNGVIHFYAPAPLEGVHMGDLVSARGFFLMNEKYEPRKGGLSVASFFVLHSMTPFTPPSDSFARNAVIAISVVALAMIVLFWLGLTRDARRSKELRGELVRRRRERRSKGSPTAPS